MNGYDTANIPISKVAVEATPGSVTHLLALQDQLSAAVEDVWGAWRGFRYGPQPMPSGADQRGRDVDDRLDQVADTMMNRIADLRRLADEIRNRT
ncbi:MAG: hypothetical protein AB7E70_20180 [Hyphomicrobiaceae bacterium]